jgi:hypothetical protein
MSRINFADLPAEARQAVTRLAEPVRSIRPAWGGQDSPLAALLVTQSGPVFVKGVPADHSHADAHSREVALAPHLSAISPRLLWHVEAGGWLLSGWAAVHGRHADYDAREDLHLVRGVMEKVQRVKAPAGVEFTTAVERWGPYADEGTAELFAGDVLLHTGWAPDNVLVGPEDQVRLVDWSWPSKGAGWIDPYMWALRLMESGHSSASAVEWACEVQSWRDGDPAAIRAFGAAVARMYQETATEEPTGRTLDMAVQAAELRAYLALEPGEAAC